MSAAAQALIVPHPPLPAIALPAELDRLLKARERVSSAPPVGDVFTEDAIVRSLQEGRWWQGHKRIDRYVGNIMGGLRFVPKAWSVDGSTGYIAGSMIPPGSEQETDNFLLGIKKNRDGRWQIASEMLSEILPPTYERPIDAEVVINALDGSGIKYGVVLSIAYFYGSPQRDPPVEDEYAKVRTENDWAIAQTAKYPERLIPFCGVNPLKDYAIAEVERCAAIPRVRGMKIHLANAAMSLQDPEQVRKLRAFFEAANRKKLAIVIHARTPHYTREEAGILLEEILPAAPDSPVQIAHMAGSWDVLKVYADAIAAGAPQTRNLYFDLTQAIPIAANEQKPEFMADAAATMRRIGLKRIFYGTDMAVTSNPPPSDWWKAIRKLPLKDDELREIANNLPPYISP